MNDRILNACCVEGLARKRRTTVLLLSKMLPLLAGCIFDLVHVNQVPATFTAVAGSPQSFVLSREVKAKLGTSFPSRLAVGACWQQVGNTEFGADFRTADQIVVVEASTIHEAQRVVSMCSRAFTCLSRSDWPPSPVA